MTDEPFVNQNDVEGTASGVWITPEFLRTFGFRP